MKKPQKQWLNRHPIVDPAHEDDLEAAAAVHELRNGLGREEAEGKAHKDYVNGHAHANAAHHLAGIRAAHAAGNDTAAAQHGQLYAGAMRHAGYDPFAAPPQEVLNHLKDAKQNVYSFKSHEADDFFLPDERAADADDKKIAEAIERMAELKESLKTKSN